MTETAQILEAFDARVERRNGRRDMFKAMLGVAAVGGTFALSSRASAQTITDNDILNFALNLEYLEAQFYSYAANDRGLAANLQTGVTTSGAQGGLFTPTGATPARKVTFSDPVVSAYAQEIAADEIAHVAFLRSALSSAAVAQPLLNLSGGAGSAFAAAATAAGVPNGSTFDPYVDDNSFLLGAFIFEDVGVTAYKGAAPLITNPTFLEAAAGILAAEAYHAAIVRTSLYGRGVTVPALRTITEQISTARDSLDGTSDLDQGIAAQTVTPTNLATTQGAVTASNIVPLDPNGIAYSRSPSQVLHIVYLNAGASTGGGFFPNGVNGTIRAAVANS